MRQRVVAYARWRISFSLKIFNYAIQAPPPGLRPHSCLRRL